MRDFTTNINRDSTFTLADETNGSVNKNVKSLINTKRPLISVIIPSYMEEKILEKTLKMYSSELKKKYNFELIVSDGGSKDNTIDIAKKYADKVVVHSREERQTISEGRNRGADHAKGDILVFINADSYPEDTDKFFSFVSSWPLNTNGLSDSVAIAVYISSFPEEELLKDKIFYTFHNFYVRVLNKLGMGMGRGECQIVRKESFKQVGGYNDKIVAGEDFDLYRRLSKIGKIHFSSIIKVLESPRRFRKYGYIRTITAWFLNSLSVMFRGKSISVEWEAVR